jgi:pimeloyl-ACP methyl ester carboxylesterase
VPDCGSSVWGGRDPDRPGWGLTYPIDHRTVDFREASARWLGVVLDGLQLEEVDLVGVSVGGFVAAAFVFEQPERVKHLVLVGGLMGLRRELPLPLKLMGHPVAGWLMLRMRITDPVVNRNRRVRHSGAHPEAQPVDFLQNDFDAWALNGAAQSGYAMMRSSSTLRGLRSDMLIAKELPSLSCPTLFLWGDADSFAPPARGQEVADTMPDARVQVVSDAGHSPHLDQPAIIAQGLRTSPGNLVQAQLPRERVQRSARRSPACETVFLTATAPWHSVAGRPFLPRCKLPSQSVTSVNGCDVVSVSTHVALPARQPQHVVCGVRWAFPV